MAGQFRISEPRQLFHFEEGDVVILNGELTFIESMHNDYVLMGNGDHVPDDWTVRTIEEKK